MAGRGQVKCSIGRLRRAAHWRTYIIHHGNTPINTVTPPLIGGFVLGKESAAYADFFQPTSNKAFSYEMGLKASIASA